MNLGVILPGAVSGLIQSKLGYTRFFIWVIIAALPALIPVAFRSDSRRSADSGVRVGCRGRREIDFGVHAMSHAVADTQVKEAGGKLPPATSELKAIILAAGKEAITADGQPLVLQPLGERSILDCVVQNALQVVPPKDIYVVVGYRKEDVRAALDGKYHYVEQANPLGTGHAVLQAVDKLKDFHGNVLILYGDTPLVSPGIDSRIAESS